jgi:hypothetical protein
MEEICSPEVADFVHTCDGAYSKSDILKMETRVCRTLDYRLNVSVTSLIKTQSHEHAAVIMCIAGCINTLDSQTRDRTIRGLSKTISKQKLQPIRRGERRRQSNSLLSTMFRKGGLDKKIDYDVIDVFYRVEGRSMISLLKPKPT